MEAKQVEEKHTNENNDEKGETAIEGAIVDSKSVADEEHPDAPAIRRQVEYYFSDQNLPNDMHLLQCCGGRQNLWVSLNRICGFKRMRQYKPKSIVAAALLKSAFLEVSEDKKQIRRKVPLQGKTIIDDDESDDEIAYDPRVKREVAKPVQLLPQRKKDYPGGVSKNMLKATGFEESYAEAPLAPAEAEMEMAMYDPDKPFTERIEIAIQRFKQKRRMHEMYAKVFNKWMKFGGVECTPRLFGTISRQEMAEMDAEEIARATATHRVNDDRDDPKLWQVDFLGVGRGFLSSYYPNTYGYDHSQVKTACQVLRSFYNYLLYHQVCDEYRDDILSARALCDQAEYELPQTYTAGLSLPGSFNVAASTIFGGHSAGLWIGDAEWAKEADDSWNTDNVGMRKEEAMVTFKTGVVVYGTDEQYEQLDAGIEKMKVAKNEAVSLEIVDIKRATDEVKDVYATQNNAWKSKLHLDNLGKLLCKPFDNDYEVYDLPRAKYPKGKLPKVDENCVYEFWVEDQVLNECFKGMKMETQVLTLNCGIMILDEVKQCMPSFYSWMANELCMSKMPKEFRLMNRHLRGLEDEDVEATGHNDKGVVNENGTDSEDFEE